MARGRTDRGAAAIELVLVTPLLIILLLFIAFVGRLSGMQGDVQTAARSAARAASLERTESAARSEADRTLKQVLEQHGIKCYGLNANIDTSKFGPGGSVTVTVDCAIKLSDLGLLVSSSRTLHSSATEVVDVYRGGP